MSDKSKKAKAKINEAVAEDKSIVTADATPLVEAVDANTAQTKRVVGVVQTATADATVAAETAAMAAEDAKVQVEETKALIEERTKPKTLIQRLAALGLILLLIYFVLASFTTTRSTQESVRDNRATLERLADANDRLTMTNDQLADQIEIAGRQRDALAEVASRQAELIRELGGEPIDIFDPSNTGGVDVTESSGTGDDGRGGQRGINPDRDGDGEPGPGGTSRPPNSGGASPTPSPRPQPSRSPLVEACVGGNCVRVPDPLPSRLPIPPVPEVPVPDIPSLGLSATIPTALAGEEQSNDEGGTSVDGLNLLSADPNNVARGLGLLVPILVGLITKKYTDKRTKAIVNVVASAVVGSAAYLVADTGGYDFAGFFNATINALIASFAAYYGVLKPTGVAGKVQDATANIGVGKVDQAAKAADLNPEVTAVESPTGETEYVEVLDDAEVQEELAYEEPVVPAEDVAVEAIQGGSRRSRWGAARKAAGRRKQPPGVEG